MKKIFKSEFLKNFMTLITGTSIAQAIPILLSPVLSRIYTPEEFGLFALYISIAGAFAVIAAGRYEGAIMLPKEDGEAGNILNLSFRISFYLCLILCALIVFFALLLWDTINLQHEMKLWLLILPLFIFMFGVTQILTNWFVRKKQFRSVATGRVVQSLVTNSTILVLGILGLSYWGIFWGNLFGLLIFTILLIILFSGSFRNIRPQLQRSQIKVVARKYRDFPLANGPQSLIDMFQVNGIIYLISGLFTTVITGLYSFAYRILMAPMNLIGSSMAQVFYQKATEIYNSGNDIRPLIRKTMLFSALLILPVLIILLLAGPGIFAFVFGEEWRSAGEYSRILAPWFCLDFVRAPISQIPMIVGKIKKMLSITFIGNIILVATMLVGGIYFKDVKITFFILSACMCLYTAGLIFWLYRSGKKTSTSI
jgi:O-antigen/teichoic acid export membrane protein